MKQEFELHSRLRHPNIVRMYAYFYDSQNIYAVMELCSFGTLF